MNYAKFVFYLQGARADVNQHFEKSLMLHISELLANYTALAGKVDKEIVPVKSLQKASVPELSQKLVEISGKVLRCFPCTVDLVSLNGIMLTA